jgi:hypothetical protein
MSAADSHGYWLEMYGPQPRELRRYDVEGRFVGRVELRPNVVMLAANRHLIVTSEFDEAGVPLIRMMRAPIDLAEKSPR